MPAMIPPAAAARHADVLESMSDAFVALDGEWRYVYVNARAEQLFGRTRASLIGQRIWDVYPEAIGEPFYHAYHRAMAEQRYVELEEHNAALDRWLETRIFPAPGGLSVFIREVSDRKRAEIALRASESRLRERESVLSLIYDNVDESLFLLDVGVDGRFRFASVNPAFVRATGLDAALVVGRCVDEIIPPPALPVVLAHYREAIKMRAPAHWEEVSEYPSGTKHGEVTVAPVFAADGRCTQLVGTVHDITERKRAEREQLESLARLQALSRQLVELQDTEHRRLSAELHDRIGQNLTALSINLNIIGGRGVGDTPEASAARLADSRTLLEATIGSVRDLITELRPAVLEDYGLLAGLRWSAERVAKRTGVAVVVEGDEHAPRLPARVEGELFRVAQEALNNAIKHARASRVTMRVERDAARTRLVVEDDGAGFDPAARAADSHAHIGLLLMRERSDAAGGTLSVESAPGKGTRVIVAIGERAA